MQVKLLAHLPLYLAAHSCRMSQDNHDKSDTTKEMRDGKYWGPNESPFDVEYTWNFDVPECGPKDAALIERVGNKLKHASILEQLVYTFDINGVSRALLQELARHRHQSLTVKSSRFTLKELKDEAPFIGQYGHLIVDNNHNYISEKGTLVSKYLVMTSSDAVNAASIKALENLRKILVSGVSNDIAKYCLPENYKTRLQTQFNGRSLQNFLRLRSDKSALWEIRDLASALYNALPEEHKYLYEDCMYDLVEKKKQIANEAY